ncbi:MAG TPA: carbohydrate ABC transporter permease [Roseiflexaceae bacterium]|nr:carbohydrate ABC transporter permease [Roseiflexaceae bacterium]
MARNPARLLRTVLYHAVAIALTAIFVVPLFWVVAFSLRQTTLPPPLGIEWIPAPLVWGNYRRIFEIIPLGLYARNSLIVVALAAPITLVVASWAGFAMAQLGQRSRHRLVLLAIFLLMVPVTSLWVTRYILFTRLGLIDSIWTLIAPAFMGSTPFFVLLFYWTFRRIPLELFESARLDGASALSVWARIAMPLARPTTVAVGMLTFSLYWSDFLNPLLFLKSDARYTLPVGLSLLKEMDETNWPLLMAGAVVMTTPVIVLFLLVQRYFWPEGRLSGFTGR